MASPTPQSANVETKDTMSPVKPPTMHSNAAVARQPLGEVSPNVKITPASMQTTAYMSKPLAGSPLKRSFAAAMEGGGGFTYLKKRRLGEEEEGHFDSRDDNTAGINDSGEGILEEGSFRPVFRTDEEGIEVSHLHCPLTSRVVCIHHIPCTDLCIP